MPDLLISVPGKVMLCGEYHVLARGGRALAFALDTSLDVHVRYSNTLRQELLLNSDLWPAPQRIDANTASRDLLIDTVQALLPAGKHKVEAISIKSELSPSYGFGSSSALRLALVFGAHLQDRQVSLQISPAKRWQLGRQAFALQKEQQGQASGYDVATQLLGGIVTYESGGNEWPAAKQVKVLNGSDLHANLLSFVHIFTGGKGAHTTTVLHATQTWLLAERLQTQLQQTMDTLHDAFTATLRTPHPVHRRALIAAVAHWRQLFATAPHFPTHIEGALQTVSGLDCSWSWKTSGAGGEDALLVIGLAADISAVRACLAQLGWHYYNYNVTNQGLHYHST